MIMYELIENCLYACEYLNDDHREDAPYVGVMIQMDNLDELELILNPADNAKEKMEYYKKTYNPDGTHKKGAPVRIVDCFVCHESEVMFHYKDRSNVWRETK
jgi:hypothetical protein